MLRLVAIQVTTTIVVALLAGFWGGANAFASALLGGLCCVVPNALFAAYLSHRAKNIESMTPRTFFFGEFAIGDVKERGNKPVVIERRGGYVKYTMIKRAFKFSILHIGLELMVLPKGLDGLR